MKISIVSMNRRGTHVMFRIFIEGIEGATRNDEKYTRKRRGSQTPQITYTKSDRPISYSWAHADGNWVDGKLIMNPITFSKAVDWPDASTYMARIMRVVLDSAHMGRVIKTLQRL
jgi:hypothetical protein